MDVSSGAQLASVPQAGVVVGWVPGAPHALALSVGFNATCGTRIVSPTGEVQRELPACDSVVNSVRVGAVGAAQLEGLYDDASTTDLSELLAVASSRARHPGIKGRIHCTFGKSFGWNGSCISCQRDHHSFCSLKGFTQSHRGFCVHGGRCRRLRLRSWGRGAAHFGRWARRCVATACPRPDRLHQRRAIAFRQPYGRR